MFQFRSRRADCSNKATLFAVKQTILLECKNEGIHSFMQI